MSSVSTSLAAIACLWLTSSAAAADAAKVVSVHDGDTITALVDGNRQVKVRLTGIDAPELGQPFGRVARDHLAELVMRKDVELVGDKRDKYGRQLSRVVIGGQDAATSMIAAGLAWLVVPHLGWRALFAFLVRSSLRKNLLKSVKNLWMTLKRMVLCSFFKQRFNKRFKNLLAKSLALTAPQPSQLWEALKERPRRAVILVR